MCVCTHILFKFLIISFFIVCKLQVQDENSVLSTECMTVHIFWKAMYYYYVIVHLCDRWGGYHSVHVEIEETLQVILSTFVRVPGIELGVSQGLWSKCLYLVSRLTGQLPAVLLWVRRHLTTSWLLPVQCCITVFWVTLTKVSSGDMMGPPVGWGGAHGYSFACVHMCFPHAEVWRKSRGPREPGDISGKVFCMVSLNAFPITCSMPSASHAPAHRYSGSTMVRESFSLHAVIAVVQIFTIILAIKVHTVHLSSSQHVVNTHKTLLFLGVFLTHFIIHGAFSWRCALFCMKIVRSLTHFLITNPDPWGCVTLDHIKERGLLQAKTMSLPLWGQRVRCGNFHHNIQARRVAVQSLWIPADQIEFISEFWRPSHSF